MIPGEYLLAPDPIVANKGRDQVTIPVRHTGDRPIQIGSHYHFFEVNRALSFDREKARGMRLNVAAGSGLRSRLLREHCAGDEDRRRAEKLVRVRRHERHAGLQARLIA